MIKDQVKIIGVGLAGETVAYEFQQKNYDTMLINGSTQDNRTLPDAKNVMVLEGYDGLAGDRALAIEALRKNKAIIKKVTEIEQKVILAITSGGGTTGSGGTPPITDIACNNPEKIVCVALLMPRPDEPIQKRINAYNTAKELMENPDLGAIIFVDNSSYTDLKKINTNLVNMLDAFFTDTSFSSGSNFDDSEKLKMLKDHGAFVIAMLSDKNSQNERGKVSTQDMINSLTAKNIFLPINDDGIVGNIGIINQKENSMNEHEVVKALGIPENIFIGHNGSVNIVCASGLGFPTEYISKLGKSALEEQRERLNKRNKNSILEDLDIVTEVKTTETKPVNKRRQISLNLLHELD